MTLIVGWVSVDNKPGGKQISAMYLASDSRYSWKQRGCDKVLYQTDYGKKLFTSSKYPEIFGFCGDVFLSKHLIEGVITFIDSGTFFTALETLDSKVQKVTSCFEKLLREFPKKQRVNCTILYGTKVGRHYHLESYRISGDIAHTSIPLLNESAVIYLDGSGKKSFSTNWIYANHEKANEYNLCRGVYHYLDGKEFMGDISLLDNIEWRNDNFERINPYTLKLKEGAQAQPFATKMDK